MMITRLLMICLVAILTAASFNFGKIDSKFGEIAKSREKFDAMFRDFSQTFKKFYFHKGEMEERKRIFKENLERMQKKFANTKNFKVNVNRFSDLTWEEFRKQYLMSVNLQADFKRFRKQHPKSYKKFSQLKEAGLFKLPSGHRHGRNTAKPKIAGENFQDSFDNKKNSLNKENKKFFALEKDHIVGASKPRLLQTSRDKSRASRLKREVDWSKYASPVQDQIRCASCYAFSAMGTFEVMFAMHEKSIYNLSEQEIIDCSTQNNGCIGGNPFFVFEYMMQEDISTEIDYAYTGVKGTCKDISYARKVSQSFDYFFLDPNIFDLLEVLEEGPVAVVLHANEAFKNYSSGVFDDKNCKGTLNHSMVALGYNLNHPTPYILLKNSWAEDWGEKGYIRMAIGALSSASDGTCLIVGHDLNIAPYI